MRTWLFLGVLAVAGCEEGDTDEAVGDPVSYVSLSAECDGGGALFSRPPLGAIIVAEQCDDAGNCQSSSYGYSDDGLSVGCTTSRPIARVRYIVPL